MKRLSIALLIIMMAALLPADDVLESKMNVKVTTSPSTIGGIELQKASGEAYGSSDQVKLGLNSSATGIGTVFLSYYAIGPVTVTLKINSPLVRTGSSGGAEDQINYKITLDKETGCTGGDFSPKTVSSSTASSTLTSPTMNTGKDYVRTGGRYQMSFATTETIENKNYGTYKSTIVVDMTSDQ